MTDFVSGMSSLGASVVRRISDIMSNTTQSLVKVPSFPLEHYKDNWNEVQNWWLMGSPLPLLAITLSYILFVLKVGPAFMKSRTPFKLNNIILIYNVVQVIGSVYMAKEGFIMLATNGLLKKECTMEQDLKKHIATCIYMYMLAKLTELLDTVFFILRKKQNQVTFLHLYHHTVMVWNTWICLKYALTFSLCFLGTANSFVHVIMYAYYGLSAFPTLTKYLWWKKYLTVLQLVQFVLVFLHGIVNHFFGCPLPAISIFIILFNSTFFFILFGNFYLKAYSKSKINNAENKKKLS